MGGDGWVEVSIKDQKKQPETHDTVEVTIRGPIEEVDTHLRPPGVNLDVKLCQRERELTIKDIRTRSGSPTDNNALVVIVRLNRENCELVNLEELDDSSLLATFQILRGKKPLVEVRQIGFVSGTFPSLLENALEEHWPIHSLLVLLPANQIPRKWNADALRTVFAKTPDEKERRWPTEEEGLDGRYLHLETPVKPRTK